MIAQKYCEKITGNGGIRVDREIRWVVAKYLFYCFGHYRSVCHKTVLAD